MRRPRLDWRLQHETLSARRSSGWFLRLSIRPGSTAEPNSRRAWLLRESGDRRNEWRLDRLERVLRPDASAGRSGTRPEWICVEHDRALGPKGCVPGCEAGHLETIVHESGRY